MQEAQSDSPKKEKDPMLKTIAEELILKYINEHSWQECSMDALGEVLYNDNKFIKIKKKKQKTFDKGVIAKQKKESDTSNDVQVQEEILKESCKRTAGNVVKDLLKRGVIIKKKKGRNVMYAPGKPELLNLYNRDIAIFQVTSGDAKNVKKMLDEKLKDKNIIVIPIDGYIMCTMKNRKEDNNMESQLEYIRQEIKKAYQRADGTVKKRASKKEKEDKAVAAPVVDEDAKFL